MRFRLIPLMLTLLTAACASMPAPRAPDFHVVRHLHTPEGERDPDLTEQGKTAAEWLAARFEHRPPAAIYVTDFRRSRQTAEPLARRHGLVPIVYDPADTPGLVARVRAGPLPALIIGHSNTVPDIVEQLGGTRPAPLSHPDFGDIWEVDSRGTTRRTWLEEEAPQPFPQSPVEG